MSGFRAGGATLSNALERAGCHVDGLEMQWDVLQVALPSHALARFGVVQLYPAENALDANVSTMGSRSAQRLGERAERLFPECG